MHGFSSHARLFLIPKSENPKFFRKSQQGDRVSMSVTGMMFCDIAGWKATRDKGFSHGAEICHFMLMF